MGKIEITKLSSRGQVVIPKEIRQLLAWEAGDHVAVEVKGDAVILRRLVLEAEREEKHQPARVSLVK
ncbi:AbrB/MazE/SpoVT family DNA-binding domain-containing protein [Neomoorella thermoacetica]|uniref:AbrB/MazE/SpoVT family DNA-binding domain-containing protein n=1 Tax=Neomoorella thermoacetica TaxID=1525 RepID=UPI0008FBAD68|nr:AbrB/MazE/SpoVT family DNA-binding domain-containing protein [Moorella thermoacetica]OIQ55627.1 SpoVT / AbrB like domain protein [Moorella thermoacetica]